MKFIFLDLVVLVILGSWLVWKSFDTPYNTLDAIWAWYPPTSQLEPHCSHLKPLERNEFVTRQSILSGALQRLGATAYILEPGAEAAFYTNVSSAKWKLSERPLLLSLTSTGKIHVLTPKFEGTRARLLPIPSESEIQFVEWAEDKNPYEAFAHSIQSRANGTTRVFVDRAIRHFIVDGLQDALGSEWDVVSAPAELKSLRERKSVSELDLLKCANEATVLAIRYVRTQLNVGMRESEARTLMRDALKNVGLEDGGCTTLFGENAALPHGSGTDRRLGENEFVLFDCMGRLHDYWSDVTRTVSPPGAVVPEKNLAVWHAVRQAQIVGLSSVSLNATTGSVDAAARAHLRKLGLDKYFTHRLGHGIGLEVHESPYLVGGSTHLIQSGNTFSNEPGVYIEGELGVRLEDCFVATEGGAILLTEGVGGMARHPWDP